MRKEKKGLKRGYFLIFRPGWICLGLAVFCFLGLAFPAPVLQAAQFARPTSDIDNTGAYTTTPLWDKLDEATPDDDTTKVISTQNASETDGQGFEVKLSALTDPNTSTGHILRIRWTRETGGKTLNMSFQLYQGATPITLTPITQNDVSAWTTRTWTLLPAEADAITDYSNLSIRVWTSISGGGAPTKSAISQVEFEVPDAAPPASKLHILVIQE